MTSEQEPSLLDYIRDAEEAILDIIDSNNYITFDPIMVIYTREYWEYLQWLIENPPPDDLDDFYGEN